MSGDFTFLKGNVETIILCSLYNGNKYGYEIAKEIKERTANRYEIKQPTLYSYLKRLEEDDLIVSYWGENSNGGRRRYYALTKTGRANCEQFVSEWQYQRSVLSDLVDGTANGVEISQEDATPLFGRRSPRRARKQHFEEELNQQDEIARRLRELTDTDEQSDEQEDTDETEPIVEEYDDEEPVEETEDEPEEEESVDEEPPAQQSTVIERVVYVERPSEPVAEPQPTESEPEQTAVNDKSRFDVNQDNAEEFMQAFEERAREVSVREPNEGENYQHVLSNIIGDQLDDMQQVDTTTVSTTTYYEDRHAALEDVADSLAKEGIRLRIYNHATATYKSKMLIPQAKVLCQASWLTYAVAFIYFGVFAVFSIALGNWSPFIIALAVLLLIPVGFTIYAIVDPTRKNKQPFNFRVAIIIASVVCVIIILASVGISALSNVEFSNFEQVSKSILIPTGVAILIPLFIVFYEVLYKKY